MTRRKSISKPRDGNSASAKETYPASQEKTDPPFMPTSPNPPPSSPPCSAAQPRTRHELPSMHSSGRPELFPAESSDVSEVPRSSIAERPAHAITSTTRQCSLQELAILNCSISANAAEASVSTFAPPAGALPTHGPQSQAGGPAPAAGHSTAAAVDFSATGARGGWMRRGGEGGGDFGAAGPADWTRHGGEGGGGGGGAPCAQPSPARRNPPPAVTAAGSARPPRAASALPSPDAVRQQVGREDRPAAPSAGQRTTSTAEAATKAAAEATAAARNDPFHFDWPHW
jgi:hypothetical protein